MTVNNMKWAGTVETFEIHAKDIEEAKKEMTGVWRGFKSRFVDCISDGERALISIETLGKLPIVQKRWDKYRIPPLEQKATGIHALEYKIAQQEKRGRGRPRGK